jgi:phosphatidylserine/phosphatidylglycerophosphate/cardiolipin synthase-like enzyme
MSEFQVSGSNDAAPFTLTIHRGEGMCLLAMNWRDVEGPPPEFVGFAIEYQEPDGERYFPLTNRLTFIGADLKDPRITSDPGITSTLRSPIQKFRWVHFPRNANKPGPFYYRVTPVFMDADDKLSLGEAQTALIELARETYPNELNVAFTRGFVSSQAFVDRFASAGPISDLLPATNDQGLVFKPTHPKTDEALPWMGFEAAKEILDLLDAAVADTTAQVRVIAYDLNLPAVVEKLEAIGGRLRIIIDDGDHGHSPTSSAEHKAEARLRTSAGDANVKRQHMGSLQHNKFIAVTGNVNTVVCGSTNFSWRGFYVQANNALVLKSAQAVGLFTAAFDRYWTGGVAAFGNSASADFQKITFTKVVPELTFSPHSDNNLALPGIVTAIEETTSSLFYSLAFLYEARAPHRELVEAIDGVVSDPARFVYGMSDHIVAGLDLRKPNGNLAIVSPGALQGDLPEPFKSEPIAGGGARMHHKFVVIDFNTNNACVYLGSHNFSRTADNKNGENLLRIRDRRIAVSYMIEALRLFDHYHFRAVLDEEQQKGNAPSTIKLKKPPRAAGELPWFDEYYTDPQKVQDRKLFAALSSS